MHLRGDDQTSFVSACGYEYARDAVDWADDFEPAAWPPCEDCLAADGGLRATPDADVVTGAYAVDDDAHLLITRVGRSWLSACGRRDEIDTVDWAGHDWPEAYEACPDCASIADAARLSDGGASAVAEQARDCPSLESRIASYRLWVVADDGLEHRPSGRAIDTAMCGAKLHPGDVQRLRPVGGPEHCHACDRAVGRARAQSRPVSPSRKSRRLPMTPARKAGKSSSAAQVKRARNPRGAEKEIALYGRRMIVPIRFVRGGLPGLGKRR